MKSKKSNKTLAVNDVRSPYRSMKSQQLADTPLNAHEKAPTEYVGNKIKYRDVSQELSEIQAYSTFINNNFSNDPLLSKLLPLNADPEHFNLYEKVSRT
jgi:hypothetical protein